MKAHMAGFGRFWRTLMKARDGGVAMIFALSLPVLTMAALVGVDVHRISTVRANLQDALDAAALAAARSPHMTNAAIAEVGMAALRANLQAYPQVRLREDLTTFRLTEEGAVIADSKVDVDTLVANIVLPPYGKLLDDKVQVGVESEVLRSSSNLEVALVLDVTGSMDDCRRNCPPSSKLEDLQDAAAELVDLVVQDVQTPYYSKIAIIPYATGVNVGSTLAAAARGSTPGSRPISGAAWASGPSRNITGATRSRTVTITANNHGFSNDDRVWISGVRGMTQLNNRVFRVSNVTQNTFRLQGVNGSSYNSYSSGGAVRKCQRNDCAVIVNASNHGFQTNARVHITGVAGFTALNNKSYGVERIDNNSFALQDSTPGNTHLTQTYASGGALWCADYGCQYYNFSNRSGGRTTHELSNSCVTERTGAQAYTDASPSSAPVGRHYPGSDACPTNQIMQLSSNRDALKGRINALTASGYTAGHIGLAWGWYAVSPNFNSLWTGEGRPAAYGARNLVKVVILMTDGEFNTAFANGVISSDSPYGTRINQNAANGDAFDQADRLCRAMKEQDIVIYTVGFALGNNEDVRDLMNNCATDSDHVFLPESGADLREAFRSIARSISNLRIAR